MENKIQNEEIVLNEKDCTSVNVNISEPNSMKDVDFTDTNGDVKHSGCDILPNNNVCNNIALSQCKNDKECVSSTAENCVMSGKDVPSMPCEESTSADDRLLASAENTDSHNSGMLQKFNC